MKLGKFPFISIYLWDIVLIEEQHFCYLMFQSIMKSGTPSYKKNHDTVKAVGHCTKGQGTRKQHMSGAANEQVQEMSGSST